MNPTIIVSNGVLCGEEMTKTQVLRIRFRLRLRFLDVQTKDTNVSVVLEVGV